MTKSPIKKKNVKAKPKKTIAKNKGGRPKKTLTKDQIEQLEKLSAYLNKEQIADFFGMSHVTLKAIQDRNEDVNFAYKKGKATAIVRAASNLLRQSATNPAAAMFYLKCQAGWKERSDTPEASESIADTMKDIAARLPL